VVYRNGSRTRSRNLLNKINRNLFTTIPFACTLLETVFFFRINYVLRTVFLNVRYDRPFRFARPDGRTRKRLFPQYVSITRREWTRRAYFLYRQAQTVRDYISFVNPSLINVISNTVSDWEMSTANVIINDLYYTFKPRDFRKTRAGEHTLYDYVNRIESAQSITRPICIYNRHRLLLLILIMITIYFRSRSRVTAATVLFAPQAGVLFYRIYFIRCVCI